MKNVISLWLGKMGTILSDRRAIAVVAAVVLSLVGIPHTVNTSDNTTVSAIVAIIQGVVILAGSLGLVKSWENRPPSGLKYKELLELFLKSETPVAQEIREWLEEAGVDLDG